METRPKFSIKPGFGATYGLIAAVVVAVILGGTWTLSRLALQKFEAEVKRRGSSLARQFASQLYEHLELGDSAVLNSLSDGILREDDLRYVIITDREGKILISNSRLRWRPMSMPNELRVSVCRTADAGIRPWQIDDEELYDIAVRLAPFSAFPSETACLGTLHIGLSQKQLIEYQRSAQFLTRGISIFTILSAIFGYFLLRSMLVNPLLALSKALRKTPAAESRQMLEAVASYGELSILKAALLHTTQTLKQKMARLQQSRTQIHAQSHTLLEKNEQQSAICERQGRSLYKLSEQARQDAQSFNSLSESAQNAVELVASTIKNTNNMKIVVGTSMESIEDVRKQVATNMERIVELGEKIAQISNVVKMINTIAAQTKLIAFNASIEAAGAGETGGRFSIVATEVRRLATTVVESVEQIKESVSSIQTATSELILSSETGIRNVNQGVLQISAIRETLHHTEELLERNSVSLNALLDSIRLQESQQQLVVNGLKEMTLQCDDAAEGVQRSHETIRDLEAMVEELE